MSPAERARRFQEIVWAAEIECGFRFEPQLVLDQENGNMKAVIVLIELEWRDAPEYLPVTHLNDGIDMLDE